MFKVLGACVLLSIVVFQSRPTVAQMEKTGGGNAWCEYTGTQQQYPCNMMFPNDCTGGNLILNNHGGPFSDWQEVNPPIPHPCTPDPGCTPGNYYNVSQAGCGSGTA